jgi:Ca2+-binding EF-hand superfamily protein
MIGLDVKYQESRQTEKLLQRKRNFTLSTNFLKEKKRRGWMRHRGKSNMLDFSDDELKKLKECFLSLDDDGSGSIGVDELETPLIGLGFADTREEIAEMVKDVDEDGSGMIEFDEFLLIIKNSDANEKTAKINKFFKDMSNNVLGTKDLSFNIIVQSIRR